jgi:hypothetical protein
MYKVQMGRDREVIINQDAQIKKERRIGAGIGLILLFLLIIK